MKRTRLFAIILALFVACTSFGMNFLFAEADTTATAREVMILFTHDLHSHLESFRISDESGEVRSVGGLARIATLIEQEKAESPEAFLLDGGDFSMGTLYQTVFSTHASELVMLGRLGYDATTIGNHEFDFGQAGLADMLRSAKRDVADINLKLPAIVQSNIDWRKNSDEADNELKAAMDEYGVSPYVIIEKGGVKCGIFGLEGIESAEDAPLSGLEFESCSEAAKAVVAELKAQDCDLIIALSHSGVRPEDENSEDFILADNVPDIDFILSAHTHQYIPEAFVRGKTVIGSAQCYGAYLGKVVLSDDGNGRWGLKEYRLIPVDESVPENAEIRSAIESYRPFLDAEYLSRFGFTSDTVIARSNFNFTPLSQMEGFYREASLGNIIADSYIYAVHESEGADYEPVALAVAPVGVIRDTIMKGDITAADVFSISSLGIGADGIAGYPLVECYLTGEEIKTLAEVDVSVSKLMPPAQLYPSGAKWAFNNHRLILNRVTDVRFIDTSMGVPSAEAYAGDGSKPEKERLYRVVGGLYSMQMLGAVEAKSYGILKISPKDRNGEAITDFNDCILYDKNGNEIKEWYALASYLASFEPGDDGVPVIPERYAGVEGRKVANATWNPVEILKAPNVVGRAVYALIGIVIITIWGVIVVIKKLRARARKGKH
jgi:2',3'-cyclic-nucleotide 2'-phosphodiesterase (5'-nucleotidase family)